MNLTEGQLFTIEALNRIDGFVWPEGAKFAAMDVDDFRVHLYCGEPRTYSSQFLSDGMYATARNSGVKHPDWRNSLITREQFDSVDGWVRNDGDLKSAPSSPSSIIDVKTNGGVESYDVAEMYAWHRVDDVDAVSVWRYHKPTKENEMQQGHPAALITDLLERYTKKRNERERLQTEIECLQTEKDRAKDDEDKLIEQIRQWHLQYGFDIRMLNESDEVPDPEPNPEPELVITDWRDLQVGDVVEITGCDETDAWNRFRGMEVLVSKIGEKERDVMLRHINLGVWWLRRGTKWKFIRRPSK